MIELAKLQGTTPEYLMREKPMIQGNTRGIHSAVSIVHLVDIANSVHAYLEPSDTIEGREQNLQYLTAYILKRYNNSPDSKAPLESNPELLEKLARETLAIDSLYDAIVIMRSIVNAQRRS